MCISLDTLLRRLAKWYMILLFVVAFIGCAAPLHWRNGQLGQLPLDLRIWYTPEQARDFFAAIGPSGCQLYAATQLTLDMLFPFIFGVLLGWLMIWTFPSEEARHLLLIPMFIVAMDLAENLTTAILALTFAGETSRLGWSAAAYTLSKWVFIIVYEPVIFGGLILKYTRWFAGRDSPS